MVSGEGLDAHVKTGWSHQQGSQEDRDRTGRGTGGSGGQEKLVDSFRPMGLRSRMNQEPGIKTIETSFVKRPEQTQWPQYL